MKIFLNSFLFCIFMFFGNAGAQPIVGIGELKIGMSEKQFLDLREILSRNIQDISKKKWSDTDNLSVWKTTSESPIETYRRIYLSDNVHYEFKFATGVKNYTGKDEYTIKAQFYKGELIEITVYLDGSTSEFKTILTEKYGKPEIKRDIKIETCQNSYGAKTEYSAGVMTWSWGMVINNQIWATLRNSLSNCGKNLSDTYNISYVNKSNAVFFAEKEEEKKVKNEVLKEKASSSKL